MSERPVNLNRVRKQKARAAQKARADENAARFGRTKAQKTLEETQAEKARRTLDLHRRDED
jgi:hypothetical protein